MPLRTLTSKKYGHSSSVISANGFGEKIPTLLINISTALWVSNKSCTEVASAKSATKPCTIQSGIDLRSRFKALLIRSSVRPLIMTLAPSCSSRWAMPNPIPAVEPVTRAVFPVSLRSNYLMITINSARASLQNNTSKFDYKN